MEVSNNFYMDDIVAGADSTNLAKQRALLLNEVYQVGYIELKKRPHGPLLIKREEKKRKVG